MVGLIKRVTQNYNFQIPNYDSVGWGTAMNRNFDIIDSVIFSLTGFGNVLGVWEFSKAYNAGQRVIDNDDGSIWQCFVAHVSASVGTFADDRTANPTYWLPVVSSIAYRGLWTTATAYNRNEFLYFDHQYAVVVNQFVSSASFDVDVANDNILVIVDLRADLIEASASADAAAVSASNAAASETSAAASETSANSSKVAAASSASAAATSAANALSYRNTASTHATNAGNSATAAATSKTGADTAKTAAEAARNAALIYRDDAQGFANDAEAVALSVSPYIQTLLPAVDADAAAAILKAVSYDFAQSLTNAQQRQTKQNIGVPFSLFTNAGTANYTVIAADNGRTIDVNAQPASRTFTLPSVATVGVGFVVTIRKIGTGFNTVTITANGSDIINIGGSSTYLLRLPDQGVTLQVTEAGIWRVVSEHGTVYSGSNANGEYTRWADGTQICTSPVISVGAVNNPTGSVFVSSTVTWTFPMAFVSRPSTTGLASVTTQWVGASVGSASSILARVIGASTDATSRDMYLTANGRWF